MNGVSPVILATSVALTGLLSFGAGFLLSSPSSAAETQRPIVDPNAWNIDAPAMPPMPVRAEQPKCSPWEVSDIAMEAVLDEMTRRGWRPPGSVERAIAEGNAEFAAMRSAELGWQGEDNGADSGDAKITVLTNSGVSVMSSTEADRILQESSTTTPASLTVDTSQPATASN